MVIHASCPHGCTATAPSSSCEEGRCLSHTIDTMLASTQVDPFQEQLLDTHQSQWHTFNQAANAYLAHIDFRVKHPQYHSLSRDYKTQKFCQHCQDLTTWILWLHPTRGTVLWCGECTYHEDIHVTTRAWKLRRMKPTLNRSVIDQVLVWVEAERLSFPHLALHIQDAQGHYTTNSPEWLGYRSAYGVLLADNDEPYQHTEADSPDE